MDYDREITEKLISIHDLVEQNRYSAAINTLPSNISYLRRLVKEVEYRNYKSKECVLCWLVTLLNNPFDVGTLLSNHEIEVLKNFLYSCIQSHKEIRKLAYKALARIPEVEEDFQNTYTGLTLLAYLKEVSKLRKIQFPPISNDDSVLAKRYKLKIMSYQDTPVSAYFDFIDDENTRLSWTLCKCIVRSSKKANKEKLVDELKQLATKIFANEAVWINVMVILGLLTLKQVDIGDVSDILSTALSYDNEAVPKAPNLRESALFLAWSLFRSNIIISDVLLNVIRVSVTDGNLGCRRAASAVILECSGRACIEDLLGLAGYKNGMLVSLINFHSVKRIEKCTGILDSLLDNPSLKSGFKSTLFKNLLLNNMDLKTQSAKVISRHYEFNEVAANLDVTNMVHMIGVLTLIYEMYGNRDTCKNGIDSILHSLDINPVEKIKPSITNILSQIRSFEITPSYASRNHFLDLCSIYVKVARYKFFSPKCLKSNLMFLLNKSILPKEVSFLVWENMDQWFSDEVFSGLRKNNLSFILANARNTKYLPKIKAKYRANLKRNITETSANVLDALKYCSFIKEFEGSIQICLEDYRTNFQGDAGAKVRMLGLRCLFCFSNTLCRPYFVRYMVDRSKYIRDECIALCKAAKIYQGKNFEFINRNIEESFQNVTFHGDSDVNMRASDISSVIRNKLAGLGAFLDCLFHTYDALVDESDMNYEDAYFKASFAASKYLEDEYKQWAIGMLATLKSSDAILHNLLLGLGSNDSKLVRTALEMLDQGSKESLCSSLEGLNIQETIHELNVYTSEREVVISMYFLKCVAIKKQERDLFSKVTKLVQRLNLTEYSKNNMQLIQQYSNQLQKEFGQSNIEVL